MSFVHLHNHTQYSLLDGACRIDRMLALTKDMGMSAVAMTDHGNLFGAVEFYFAAKKAGIKPIIGMEAYIIDGDYRTDRKAGRRHLVLLAQNEQGWKNLIKLCSLSWTEGFYYKPRINRALLNEHKEGLIVLSACIKGEIPQLLLQNRVEEARETALWYKQNFPDRFYMEIQNHQLPDEVEVLPRLVALAAELEIPLVATNDCHYLHKSDANAHEILLCIQTGKVLSDEDRLTFGSRELYFKSPQEMEALLGQYPGALANTQKIADSIELELSYKDYVFPPVNIPAEYPSAGDYLRALSEDGIARKYGQATPEILDRMNFELDIIHRMGFDNYFLVVKDLIDKARSMDIPVGPGRGSAAGCIVSYLLDITRLDPIKYGLLFERFLDLNRAEMPDIDIDFCARGRSRVIDYAVEKYGRNAVTQIVTFGTLGAKSVIKDVGRVMGLPPAETNRITKMMSDKPGVALEDCLKESVEFRELMESNDLYRTVLRHALVLEGLVRQIGVHAAGVVIGPGDLSDYVPLGVSKQKNGEPVVLVQFEGKWLNDLKMLKIDFLGLKTLTLIDITLRLIRENGGPIIEPDKLPLDNQAAYELLSRGQTDGVFQFESAGMKRYLMELQPNRLEDLVAMVALFRPGPMQFIDTYIKRKHGKEPVVFEHPLQEAQLKETYGVTVYQEQVMQQSKDMAGFTSAEAGTLRKAMSKKSEELLGKMKTKFFEGSQANGVSETVCQKIWDGWTDFARYAFNKSHAACYAFVAYQTAYLKANHPVEFMAALLSIEDDPDKIPKFIDECRNMGIDVLPPDVNSSRKEFSIENSRIRFGLRGIKNVGDAAIDEIIREQANGPFKNIFDFTRRVNGAGCNRTVLESLAMAGALDCLPGNRAQKVEAVDMALSDAQEAARNKDQINIFDMFSDAGSDGGSTDLSYPALPEVAEYQLPRRLELERNVLGFYLSGHPLMPWQGFINLFCNGNDYNQSGSQPLRFLGMVTGVTKKNDARKRPFAIVALEDMQNRYELRLFSENYDRWLPTCQENAVLFVEGSLSSYGTNSEHFYSVDPRRIMEADLLPDKLGGELYVYLSEEDASPDLARDFVALAGQHKGRFKLRFVVDTAQFKTVHLHADNLGVFPSPAVLNAFSAGGKHPVKATLISQ